MSFAPTTPWHSLDLTPFRGLPPTTWSKELHEVRALVDAVVDQRCREILTALGDAEVPEDRVYARDWIRRRLEAAGEASWTEDELATAVAELTPSVGTTFALIDHVAAHYPEFLRGEVRGAQFLFKREALELWAGYFANSNLAYSPTNTLAAATAETAVEGERLRILEVGGGCGSAAAALLGRLGDRVAEYWFTDVAPVFLSRGKRMLTERFPEVSFTFRRIDLDRRLEAQGIPRDTFDLAYAVNTLHAVRDLSGSLAEVRFTLAKGGALVLGEGVRPEADEPVAIEMVFLPTATFACQRGVFLHWRDWEPTLRRAGYSHVSILPDLEAAVEAYPGYSLAGLVARS